MNLWHDISVGDDAPEEINAIIEVPRGSHNKYEVDKETGLISLDRANYSSAPYPIDYGFIPQTYWHDEDPFDVAILSSFPIHIGVLVTVRPVAYLEMEDDGDDDSKVIGVPAEDRRWEDVQALADLNKHTLKEIRHFFETYKELKKDEEGNEVVVKDVHDKKKALEAIGEAQTLYQKHIAS